MIDESFDTEQMKQPVQPWEFRAKPAWQRLLIMIGGVLVNFLLALFIYSMVLFNWGDQYMGAKDLTMGYKFNQQAKAIGFQDHDIIVGYDGKDIKKFDVDLFRHVADAKTVQVMRQGKAVTINMPDNLSLLEMLQSDRPFIAPYLPSVIDTVLPDSPASKAGISRGDRILSFNGHPIDSWTDYDEQIHILSRSLEGATTNDSLRKRTVSIVVQKAANPDTLKILLSQFNTALFQYFKSLFLCV
jgi:regulator of sigma E protease